MTLNETYGGTKRSVSHFSAFSTGFTGICMTFKGLLRTSSFRFVAPFSAYTTSLSAAHADKLSARNDFAEEGLTSMAFKIRIKIRRIVCLLY